MKEVLANIDSIKKEILGKSKNQQLKIIRQAKINFGLGQKIEAEPQVQDKEFELQIDALLHEVENDNSFKYDCDWNWFFNADNIPNQELVFSTKDFLETNRKAEVDPLFMVNVLLRQVDELKSSLDFPVDFVNKLKSLPLEEVQKYILLGLIIKWYGGYPINNLNPKYDTILKLIEREFLSMFPNQQTPEKEFCAININTQKTLKEPEAQINAEFKRQYAIRESKYLDKVTIDFEDLPEYVVQRGIIWRFESERLLKDAEYLQWRDKLLDFIKTTPKKYTIKVVEKGIEYAKKVYHYHLDEECTNPEGCLLNQSWERRIAMAEDILASLLPERIKQEPNSPNPQTTKSNSPRYKISIPTLSEHEKLWAQEIYERSIKGERFTFRNIWTILHKKLPPDFQPSSIDERIVGNNGEEIRLLGVIALQGSYTILDNTDSVIRAIRDIVIENPDKRTIEISEIAEKCLLSTNIISFILQLVREYGTFYTGSGYNPESTILKNIDVGGNEKVYYEYVRFPGIEQLILLKSYRRFSQPLEEFTTDEILTMSTKLDAVLEELQSLKLGHEIIYTDVLSEIEELKAHFAIGKKNWKQLFMGKIVDMVTSGVISETVSKRIADIINPSISRLLH